MKDKATLTGGLRVSPPFTPGHSSTTSTAGTVIIINGPYRVGPNEMRPDLDWGKKTQTLPPPTRLSWESTSLSGVDTLKVISAPTPALASDEILVGVRAIGLN